MKYLDYLAEVWDLFDIDEEQREFQRKHIKDLDKH